MEQIDYEAIFKNDSQFFEAIPDNEHTKRRLHTFTKSIQQEPLRDISSDIVGQIYQELIPTDERKELGQFYTPKEIGKILSRWAINSTDDRFLDPCSGSGSITVEAYKKFDQLNGLSHQETVRRITAVDINKFPLHLTALNLATRDIHEPTNELFAYYEDFFHLDPDTKRQNSHRLGVGGTGTDTSEGGEAIGTFDATAANPPYVRQEQLYPNREMYRKHLKRFGPSSKTTYYDGEKEIDGRSDLYCYFLTHVTQFLREDGRLAWIVPTKWMVADYGPSLQQFLFDHYKVQAVVGFRKRVFEDALVDTVLLMMERCEDASERRQTEVNGRSAQRVLAEAETKQGKTLRILTYFIEYDDQVYQFQGLTAAERYETYRSVFERTTTGFDELRDSDKLNVKPTRFTIAPASRTAAFRAFVDESVLPDDVTAVQVDRSLSGHKDPVAVHDSLQIRSDRCRCIAYMYLFHDNVSLIVRSRAFFVVCY